MHKYYMHHISHAIVYIYIYHAFDIMNDMLHIIRYIHYHLSYIMCIYLYICRQCHITSMMFDIVINLESRYVKALPLVLPPGIVWWSLLFCRPFRKIPTWVPQAQLSSDPCVFRVHLHKVFILSTGTTICPPLACASQSPTLARSFSSYKKEWWGEHNTHG